MREMKGKIDSALKSAAELYEGAYTGLDKLSRSLSGIFAFSRSVKQREA